MGGVFGGEPEGTVVGSKGESVAAQGSPRFALSRRRFLTLGAGGVGFAAAPSSVRWVWDAFAPMAAGAAAPSFTWMLTRSSDQLRMLFEFVNLVRSGDRMVAQVPLDPQYVRIVLGSQHTVEEAIA